METAVARRMWRTLEPYHGMIYFAPEASHLDYFAARSAAMGVVAASVVTSTFFNFSPSLVAASIPKAWSDLSPADTLAARLAAADAALRRVLGEDAPSGLVEAAELARKAAEAAPVVGRPLAAAHLALPWPDSPRLVLWQAITVLREFRGDGHINTLVAAELDGCQALVMHAASGELPRRVLQSTRGWTDAEWSAAEGALGERGLIEDGQLTSAGRDLRSRYEEETDRLALAAWRAIGEEQCAWLRSTVRPWSKAIVDSGTFAPVRPS